MNNLENLLFRESSIEKAQKINHQFIMDIPTYSFKYTGNALVLDNSCFFKQNNHICISKHNRYAFYPEHSHHFIEMNYMFSGNCTQVVNGEKISLKKGDIIFLDIGSKHSINALGKNDILINFLFKEKDFKVNLLNKITEFQGKTITPFFNLSIQQLNQQQCHIFRNNPDNDFHFILNNIISEYYFPKSYSNEIIKNNLSTFFLILTRNYKETPWHLDAKNNNSVLLLQILEEINNNYNSLTLTSIANKMNYNKNYLSNFIKNQTGKTFTELLNITRINEAHKLIENSDYSITQISEIVGFSSKTYFYSEYKKHFNHLPSCDRKTHLYNSNVLPHSISL